MNYVTEGNLLVPGYQEGGVILKRHFVYGAGKKGRDLNLLIAGINGLDFEGIIPSLRRMTIFVSSVPIQRPPSCGYIVLFKFCNKLTGAVIDVHHDQGGIPVEAKITANRFALGQLQKIAVGGDFFTKQRNRLGIVG